MSFSVNLIQFHVKLPSKHFVCRRSSGSLEKESGKKRIRLRTYPHSMRILSQVHFASNTAGILIQKQIVLSSLACNRLVTYI